MKRKLVFEIEDVLKAELEHRAKQDNRSLASYVRQVLQGHVDQAQEEREPATR